VVAVKELLVHPGLGEVAAAQAAQRAMREARITARLHHPHAIGVYDAVEQDGRPYLIMEYLLSHSLQHLLTERTTLGVEEVAAIGSQIAAALGAAHRAGIVHRDVKPGNVLLTEDGTAKLTDFGISRAVGDVTVTTSGMVTGTPAYLAPEVATGGAADFPADVFSFGSTLYAALEGHPPFGGQGNPIAVLHRVASGHVIPPRRCGRLTPLITEMLQHVPARRPTMPQVEQALAIAAAGGAAPATSQPLASPSQQTQQLTLAANPPANQAAEIPRPPALPPTRLTSSARPTPTRDIPIPAASSPRRRNRGLLIAATAAIVLVLTGAVITLATTLRGGKATTSSLPAAPKIAGRSTAATTTPVVPSIAAGVHRLPPHQQSQGRRPLRPMP
jgi:serine/threonine protein kinase